MWFPHKLRIVFNEIIKKKTKPLGSEWHNTTGTQNYIHMNIHELHDDLGLTLYILDDIIKPFQKSLDDI